MLLLIPNAFEGLAMQQMAQRLPDDRLVGFLAGQLDHAQWTGCTVWDLIMPSFLFIAGVSLSYSRAARISDAASFRLALRHAIVRALTLMLLGLFLMITVEKNIDLLWPLLLLMVGMPLGEWLAKALRRKPQGFAAAFNFAYAVVALIASAAWLWMNRERSNWAFHDVLPQLALVYVFAFLLAGCSTRTRYFATFAILFLYWLAFALYPLPHVAPDPASIGLEPGDEVFSGFLAHWNKGTNIAAAFDRWFLDSLPRAEPFAFNGHGYTTLNFIPSIASVLIGTIVGDYLRTTRDPGALRNRLLLAAAACLLAGSLLGLTICPVVKSIWTPAFVLFSTGWVLIIFSVFYHFYEVRHGGRWLWPLVVAGLNPIVLYVFSRYYRYWILEPWHRMLGSELFAMTWAPVLDAALVGLSLWVMALAMYRLRLFIRL